MIKIKDLEVVVSLSTNDKKKILNKSSLEFEIGQNYCLLGKNGSGKSTLSGVLMGNPKYEVIGGEVNITINRSNTQGITSTYNKLNLLELSPEERSKAGIFLSFQNIPEIPGIKLIEYLRIIYNISNISILKSYQYDNKSVLKDTLQSLSSKEAGKKIGEFKGLSPFVFKRFIKKYLLELDIDEKLLVRDLNVGFSGGEKRKIEILQMKLINPKYIILDEIDSGLDLDAFKTVANELKKISSPENTLIIITHYFKILDYIDIDKVYVLKDGKVDKEGGKELIDEIIENGFK